jgi:hypothetical protein
MYPVWSVSDEMSPEMCIFSILVTGEDAKRRHSVKFRAFDPTVFVTTILKYWYGVVAFTVTVASFDEYVRELNSVSLYHAIPSLEPNNTPALGARSDKPLLFVSFV